MTSDEHEIVRLTSARERRKRRMARRPRGWRAAARAKEEGWDRRLARIWGSLLIVGFVLPMGYQAGWNTNRRWIFAWDLLEDVETLGAVWVLLPLVLGVTAIAVAGAKSPRVRGLVLLVGSLLVSVVPVAVSGPLLFGPLAPRALHLIALWLIVLLAPPLVAGANHVARRAEPDALLRTLIGIGGLALLLALFLPLGPDSESILGLVFGSRGPFGQASEAWPILIWILLVVLYAAVASLYLVARLEVQRFGGWLSMAGRVALYGLPVAILLLAVFAGAWDRQGFLPSLLVLAGGLFRLYGVMILTALGLALVLDRTPAATDPARLVEAF